MASPTAVMDQFKAEFAELYAQYQRGKMSAAEYTQKRSQLLVRVQKAGGKSSQ